MKPFHCLRNSKLLMNINEWIAHVQPKQFTAHIPYISGLHRGMHDNTIDPMSMNPSLNIIH